MESRRYYLYCDREGCWANIVGGHEQPPSRIRRSASFKYYGWRARLKTTPYRHWEYRCPAHASEFDQ